MQLPILPRLFVIDREDRQLDIFKWNLRRRRYFSEKRFDVTVGKIGSETPHGLYYIIAKSRTPSWRIPQDEDYSPETWGTIIPFDDLGNPFAGGFISLSGKETGIGIHGTKFDPKVGTAASHGCIRMQTFEFLKIYDLAKINTPVYLH